MLRFCYRRKVKLTGKSINKSSRAWSRGDVELRVVRLGWLQGKDVKRVLI